MKFNHVLGKAVGQARRYSRNQFKKLLTKTSEVGLWENWGQDTIISCKNYLEKLGIEQQISYQDYYNDFLDDLSMLMTSLQASLVTNKGNLADAQKVLQDWQFFSDFDSERYDY